MIDFIFANIDMILLAIAALLIVLLFVSQHLQTKQLTKAETEIYNLRMALSYKNGTFEHKYLQPVIENL